MERLLIQGGHEYLPFARSRIRALKTLGMRYVSQTYTVNGVTINVRLENGTECIRIQGGKHRLLSGFLANGFVTGDVLDAEGNIIGQLPAVQPSPDGSVKYRMGKFWPRDDLREKDEIGWLESGNKPETLANLDLTLNGTSFRAEKIPFPDARACEYGKRGPASLYTGTMRKVVQVLLGRCEGEPRVETTPEKDRLEYGFNNADIPYAYTFDNSHGVFTCSDHTKEKPNVWVIEISAQRGILAWKMDTRKVSKTGNPDLYETLGYLPVPTPRPVSADANQRGLKTLWSGGDELSEYFGHAPFYQDCGWAFSYSGRKAANVSVEEIRTESGVRLLSAFTNLWEIEITEGMVEKSPGVLFSEPISVSLVRRERKRARWGPTNEMKVPAFAPDVGRTLLSVAWGAQWDDYPEGMLTFPVFCFYGHDSEDLKVISSAAKPQTPSETLHNDFLPSIWNDFRYGHLGLRKNGTSYQGPAGGFVGGGMPQMIDEKGFTGEELFSIAGSQTGQAMQATIWREVTSVDSEYRKVVESYFRVQSLICPFGDREAAYLFQIDVSSRQETNRSLVRRWGLPNGKSFNLSNTDVWNPDGTYWGNRAEFTVGPSYDPSGRGLIYGRGGTIAAPAVYLTAVGESIPITPAMQNEELSIPSIKNELDFTTSMSLVTSASSIPIPTYGRVYIDPRPSDEPYNREQFAIPGDTMSNHLIDVTAEAFTGAVVASEGMYRGAHYDTFVGNAEGYPATEIDFRFGYWIGVPMFKGEKT